MCCVTCVAVCIVCSLLLCLRGGLGPLRLCPCGCFPLPRCSRCSNDQEVTSLQQRNTPAVPAQKHSCGQGRANNIKRRYKRTNTYTTKRAPPSNHIHSNTRIKTTYRNISFASEPYHHECITASKAHFSSITCNVDLYIDISVRNVVAP